MPGDDRTESHVERVVLPEPLSLAGDETYERAIDRAEADETDVEDFHRASSRSRLDLELCAWRGCAECGRGKQRTHPLEGQT